jgi:hypothetical protein
MNDHDESESRDESDVSYEQHAQQQSLDNESDWYEFRVEGHLAAGWSEWLDGLAITNLGSGEALLTGPVIDQAALHGLLVKIRDMNLKLLSVRKQ